MTSHQRVNLTSTEEGSFKNADGLKIFTKYWRPSEKPPRALVFICHGFGEHCSRYEKLGNALADVGCLAFSHDHVGHGHSDGERVQVSDFDLYLRDVFQHIDQVSADNAGIPIFMFGHSMGGTIAILSVIDRPDFFTGAVFSGPSVTADPDLINPCKVFFGKIAAWILPSCQVVPPLDPSLITRNPEEVKKYVDDPLNWHGGMKAKWVNAILTAMDKIQSESPTIKLPYFLACGGADLVVKPDSSKYLDKHTHSKDQTLKIYEDCYHELLNEQEESAEMFIKDVLEWIKKRLQP